mgnify:CR=1 FL=1
MPGSFVSLRHIIEVGDDFPVSLGRKSGRVHLSTCIIFLPESVLICIVNPSIFAKINDLSIFCALHCLLPVFCLLMSWFTARWSPLAPPVFSLGTPSGGAARAFRPRARPVSRFGSRTRLDKDGRAVRVTASPGRAAQRSMIPQRARGLSLLFDAPAQRLRTPVAHSAALLLKHVQNSRSVAHTTAQAP